MAQITLGMNCGLYFGNPPTTEMTNVKDVTLTLETGETDVTTRKNQGWRSIIPVVRECSVEFEMNVSPSDAGYCAVRNAFLFGGGIRIAVLSSRRKPGAEGIVGVFAITGFTRNEPLDGAQTVSVTAKLQYFVMWLVLEVFQRESVASAVYSPPVDVPTIATVTISCSPSNSGTIYFQGDTGQDVPWLPGESHTFTDIDLSTIQFKGTPGDTVRMITSQWLEA